jgi:hypothetical protein
VWTLRARSVRPLGPTMDPRAEAPCCIRLAGGKLTVTDGSFTVMKEVIGGWAIIKATRRPKRSVSRPSSWGSTSGTGRSSRGSLRCAQCSSRGWGRSRFATEEPVDDDHHSKGPTRQPICVSFAPPQNRLNVG